MKIFKETIAISGAVIALPICIILGAVIFGYWLFAEVRDRIAIDTLELDTKPWGLRE